MKLNQLRVCFDYIKISPVGMLLSLFCAIFERTLDEWLRVCGGHILGNL